MTSLWKPSEMAPLLMQRRFTLVSVCEAVKTLQSRWRKMFMDVTVSHLVSNRSLLSSSSLLVICTHTQHDDNRCLVMEASQTAASFHLEAIQHSHTSCHAHVQHTVHGLQPGTHFRVKVAVMTFLKQLNMTIKQRLSTGTETGIVHVCV